MGQLTIRVIGFCKHADKQEFVGRADSQVVRKICVVVFALCRSVSAAAPQASRALDMCNRSCPFNLGMIATGNH